MTEPKYRFKKTDGHTYPAINTRTVGEVFSFVTEKNKGRMVDNVITNSAEFGLIPQREFFDKDIASKDNTDGYTVIQKGDFVYNPRKSSTAPYGPFNCYRLEEKGIVSPLYTCLRQKMDGVSADYLEWYFASNAWHRYIYNNGAQGGARHDRVGMTNDLMKGIPVAIPSVEEQNKISELLDSVTSLISTLTEEVRLWEEKKKGIMQKIFSQEVRFKDENGEDYPEWEGIRISDMVENIIDKNHPDETVLTIVQGHGTVPRDNSERRITYDKSSVGTYKRVKYGDYIMHLRSFEGGLEMATVEGIVSPAYTIMRPKVSVISDFYRFYFRSYSFISGQLRKITEGIRDGKSINMSDFWQLRIPYPCSEEQEKIADCLYSIDNVITIKKQKLEAWQNIKKGLLQQMFV